MLALVVAVLAACTPQSPSTAPASSAAPAPTEASPLAAIASAAASAAPTAAAWARAPASASASAPASAPPPAVERSGKVWPFHAWNGAVAVTYNHMRIRPGIQLLAYDERGWSPNVVEQRLLSKEKADEAVNLVAATEGGVDVSKCPFPRHAVVLLHGDVPVASINVCFECGDIKLWPAWGPEPDWEKLTAKEMKALELRAAKQMKLYDKAWPKWKAFFRDEVGFPLEGSW